MKKYIFSFCTAECSHCNLNVARGDIPASALPIRLDALTCKYMNTTNKSIANLGYRTPSWQCRLRGRVAPKLACVQDIRPHVPELGCTSAVQNEKMYFSFCTAECNHATCNYLEHKLNDDVPASASSQARCLEVANT